MTSGLGLIAVPPDVVAEHDHRRRAIAVVVGSKVPAEHRARTDQANVFAEM